MKLILAAAVAVMALRMPAALARCADEAVAELAKYGVARDQISGIDVQRQTVSEGGTQGLLIWMTLHFCQGYAVVETTTSCIVVQAYTTRDCHIKGLSNY